LRLDFRKLGNAVNQAGERDNRFKATM
jgi:hypothetical protein